MRSRYCAYVLKLADYLLATWHSTTRPSELDLSADESKWLGLEIKRHAQQDATHASVEFVARYRIAGRGHRLHELSRFQIEDGRWVYIDGQINP
jgi:SEC-C motif domain protein